MEYSVANVVANGWLNIEYYGHPIYWVQDNISLSELVFNKKIHHHLIGCFQGQKRNSSSRISKLKEPCTEQNMKAIQYIFHPDKLHSRCHFPKKVAEYFSKRLNNLKEKIIKYGDNEFYTKTYPVGEVQLGWKMNSYNQLHQEQ